MIQHLRTARLIVGGLGTSAIVFGLVSTHIAEADHTPSLWVHCMAGLASVGFCMATWALLASRH